MNNNDDQCLELYPKLQRSRNYFLDFACKCSPILGESIETYGDFLIYEYLNTFKMNAIPGYQTLDDLFDVIIDYASPLLGREVAHRTVRQLSCSPTVLSANHHGVDYFAQSVQSSLLFSLMLSNQGLSNNIVPIFACGNVALNNLTYPRGLLIYASTSQAFDNLPLKIPIFSDSMKRMMVSVTSPIQKEQIHNTLKKLKKLNSENLISESQFNILEAILSEDYLDPAVLELNSYSLQSVVLNHRIWKRLYQNSAQAPDLVYLELEEIAGRLLSLDLTNSDSLAWRVMFDPLVRDGILEQLDGAQACWQDAKLFDRSIVDLSTGRKVNPFSKCGTHFFWGIDSNKKRVPLYLDRSDPQDLNLKGTDDKGNDWISPFDPSSIIENLQLKKLVPSLFSSYLTVALARGITCIGGYYQSEYLPKMQQAVVNVLQNTDYEHIATRVSKIRTNKYLSGMQTVMSQIKNNAIIPAGPVEIIASGGIRTEDLEQLKHITVREAHQASLFETIPDIAPAKLKTQGWKNSISEECYDLLKQKIVIKEYEYAA